MDLRGIALSLAGCRSVAAKAVAREALRVLGNTGGDGVDGRGAGAGTGASMRSAGTCSGGNTGGIREQGKKVSSGSSQLTGLARTSAVRPIQGQGPGARKLSGSSQGSGSFRDHLRKQRILAARRSKAAARASAGSGTDAGSGAGADDASSSSSSSTAEGGIESMTDSGSSRSGIAASTAGAGAGDSSSRSGSGSASDIGKDASGPSEPSHHRKVLAGK